jgi:hypothetical protein
VQEVGGRLYASAEELSNELIDFSEMGVEVDVREGSLELVTIILTTAGILYAAIVTYDSFWSGVERVRAHAKKVGEVLGRQAVTEADSVGGNVVATSVTLGHLDKLHRVHRALRAGEIDAEAAVLEVIGTLRTSGEPVTPALISQIERALGAKSRGLERLTEMRRRRKPEREFVGKGVGPPLPQPERKRRITIRRRPGELTPTIKFDR